MLIEVDTIVEVTVAVTVLGAGPVMDATCKYLVLYGRTDCTHK